MIGFIKGIVDLVELDHCLVDVQGVGYRISITLPTAGKIHVGDSTKLYTHLAVREDDMSLYGFLTLQELEAFRMLLSVSGIGAKVALGILSDISSEGLSIAIANKDMGRLTKISGIGKKTAERMLLELKDKIGSFANDSDDRVSFISQNSDDGELPILEVLRSLGYQNQEILPVLKKLDLSGLSESDAVKFALKELSKRG